MKIVVLSCLAALGVAPAAAAQPQPGSELTVYLATMGPGDQVWENFGHNALWISDAATGTTVSYNYGMFSFDQPGFIPRLMKGSMLYSMAVQDAEQELAAYAYYNRTVTTQRLNLTAAQKHALREFLEWNWLPANRDYLYDYFRDNCSTRLRDALDRVLGGALRETLTPLPTGATYRSHSLRLTAASPATWTGLLLGLGMPTDRPITAWEESFIPMELMRHLRSVQVRDESGRAIPLVAEEQVLFQADRPAPAASPPARTGTYLLIGLLLAAGLLALARAARTHRTARAGLAVTLSVWGVLAGVFGVILTLLWLFTDHVAAYPNLNLLLVNPLALLLAAAAPLAATRGPHAPGAARLARPLASVLLAFAALALIIRLLPLLHQQNGPLIALLLPVHAAVLFSLYYAAPGQVSPAGDSLAAARTPAAA